MKSKIVFVFFISFLTNILQGSDPLLTPRTRAILTDIGLQNRKNAQKSCEFGKADNEKRNVQAIFDKIFAGRDYKDASAELSVNGNDSLVIKFVWPDPNLLGNNFESWVVLPEMLQNNRYEQLLGLVKERSN